MERTTQIVASRWFNNTITGVIILNAIVISLIPATGQLATLARLARLLRVLRLISTSPELRLIVTTLIRSIPSMGHVLGLMSIIFYVCGVAGYHLFHDVDPTHWRRYKTS